MTSSRSDRWDFRLAGPAAFGWIVLLVVQRFPEVAVPTAIASFAVAVALAATATRARGPLPALALGVLVAGVLATSCAASNASRSPPVLETLRPGETVEVTAQVTRQSGRGSPFAASTISIDGRAVNVPVTVFTNRSSVEPVALGSTLRFIAHVERAEPGRSAAWLLFARELEVTPPTGVLLVASELRARFATTAAALPGPGARLLPGLALGDTTAVDETLDTAMKRSSLSHLTAVSGANCAVVVGLALLLSAAIGLRRGVRTVVALGVLGAFVVLVTPEPSVIRAATMASLVLLTLAIGRPVRGLPVLSLAVIVLLAFDPWLASEFGFVLSVLATAGIIILAGPFADLLGLRMPRWLALVIAVPIAAQIGCQPVLILLDASLPTYGVIANVLAAPAAPMATILGLFASLLLPVIPPLGGALTALAWLPASWIGVVAILSANLPGARIPWPPGPAGATLLGVVSLLAAIAVCARRTALRRVTALACAAVSVAVLAATGGAATAQFVSRPRDWSYAACDVAQGDAVLIRSAGSVALVDTGAHPDLLRSCLRSLGIERIDLLVLSHFDFDHVGAAREILGSVGTVITGPTAREEDEQLLRAFATSGAKVREVHEGVVGVLGSLEWRVLWPPRSSAAVEPGNEASVVTLFRPRDSGAASDGEPAGGLSEPSALLLGDLGEEAQRRMAARSSIGRVDVVKVSHHGSADQSEALYREAAASVGLISVGAENGYGHPAPRVLSILESAGTTAARTDESGLVLVSRDERGVLVWRESGGSPAD